MQSLAVAIRCTSADGQDSGAEHHPADVCLEPSSQGQGIEQQLHLMHFIDSCIEQGDGGLLLATGDSAAPAETLGCATPEQFDAPSQGVLAQAVQHVFSRLRAGTSVTVCCLAEVSVNDGTQGPGRLMDLLAAPRPTAATDSLSERTKDTKLQSQQGPEGAAADLAQGGSDQGALGGLCGDISKRSLPTLVVVTSGYQALQVMKAAVTRKQRWAKKLARGSKSRVLSTTDKALSPPASPAPLLSPAVLAPSEHIPHMVFQLAWTHRDSVTGAVKPATLTFCAADTPGPMHPALVSMLGGSGERQRLSSSEPGVAGPTGTEAAQPLQQPFHTPRAQGSSKAAGDRLPTSRSRPAPQYLTLLHGSLRHVLLVACVQEADSGLNEQLQALLGSRPGPPAWLTRARRSAAQQAAVLSGPRPTPPVDTRGGDQLPETLLAPLPLPAAMPRTATTVERPRSRSVLPHLSRDLRFALDARASVQLATNSAVAAEDSESPLLTPVRPSVSVPHPTQHTPATTTTPVQRSVGAITTDSGESEGVDVIDMRRRSSVGGTTSDPRSPDAVSLSRDRRVGRGVQGEGVLVGLSTVNLLHDYRQLLSEWEEFKTAERPVRVTPRRRSTEVLMSPSPWPSGLHTDSPALSARTSRGDSADIRHTIRTLSQPTDPCLTPVTSGTRDPASLTRTTPLHTIQERPATRPVTARPPWGASAHAQHAHQRSGGARRAPERAISPSPMGPRPASAAYSRRPVTPQSADTRESVRSLPRSASMPGTAPYRFTSPASVRGSEQPSAWGVTPVRRPQWGSSGGTPSADRRQAQPAAVQPRTARASPVPTRPAQSAGLRSRDPPTSTARSSVNSSARQDGSRAVVPRQQRVSAPGALWEHSSTWPAPAASRSGNGSAHSLQQGVGHTSRPASARSHSRYAPSPAPSAARTALSQRSRSDVWLIRSEGGDGRGQVPLPAMPRTQRDTGAKQAQRAVTHGSGGQATRGAGSGRAGAAPVGVSGSSGALHTTLPAWSELLKPHRNTPGMFGGKGNARS